MARDDLETMKSNAGGVSEKDKNVGDARGSEKGKKKIIGTTADMTNRVNTENQGDNGRWALNKDGAKKWEEKRKGS